KKNSSTLKNVVSWLDAQYPNGVSEHAMLLIDDESDYASINTKEMEDPTIINKKIRKLISLFKKTSYVAFTATPYANIFIDHEASNTEVGLDLFPKDFIYLLEPPSNYLGAKHYFVDNPENHIVNIDDYEDSYPLKHKITHIVEELPNSLIEAISLFYLNVGIRYERGFVNNHNLLRQLRIASQQLRIVDLAPMRVISSFWNHGFLSNLNDVIVMPQSWLGVRRSLELLSSRVIDMAVCNGFEFLPNNWIYANGHWECGDLVAFELYRYPIELACHPGHPLVKLDALTGREFWSYPSVALPNELFPRKSQALIAKGLWQDIVQTKRHSWKHWEGLSRDRKHLVYTNCLRRRLMPAGIEIKVLPFDLDMMDVDVVVVSRSIAGVGSVQALFKSIKDLYVNLLMSGELNAQNS
ncbi:MAG: hypothetical protein EBY22_12795, partial [Gammaproteobacteria bacterium]|nr:hypothetical protein [Gammaproteobacteria bacterium]